MTLFFIDTGDCIEFKKTEAEARALAQEALEFWKKRARDEGEWDDEVDRVCWGPVQEKVKAVVVGDGGDYTEYQLRPNWEAIAAETAHATRERHEEAERIAGAESGMLDAASEWTKAWRIIAQALKEMRCSDCDGNRLAGC